MKVLAKVSLFVAVMMASSMAFASNTNGGLIDKTRAAVANAAPDDWETLAKAAHTYIRKNKNMKEAYQWLNQSLEIKETPYNLEVKGDYYMKNKLPKKAMACYVASMKKTRAIDPNTDNTHMQEKIAKAYALQAKIG